MITRYKTKKKKKKKNQSIGKNVFLVMDIEFSTELIP